MAERRRDPSLSLVAESDQPLIAIPLDEDGREGVRYLVAEAVSDAAQLERVTREALGVIGAWDDLDWDELEAALDRIRHESRPTPPIEL